MPKNNKNKKNAVEENRPEKTPKKLSEHKQAKPVQLTLFELIAPADRRYSNTLELYDFMPKYYWGKTERINGKFLDSLEREFENRGTRYKISISPARIKDENGKERYFYAGKREEMVEEALRKLIVEGSGVTLDGDLGIVFAVNRLKEELKRTGHTYSEKEIKDSIRILNDLKITLITEDGKETGFHPIETYGFVGENGEDQTFVKFSAWVTSIIKSGKYRLFDYEKVMTYKNAIARMLHKRFNHHHVSASITRPYNIMLTTLLRDFGLTVYDKISNNLREVEKALKEMIDHNVIITYKIEKVYDVKRRNKIVDAKIILTPSMSFESDIIRANDIQKQNRHLFDE